MEPTDFFESEARRCGYRWIAGVDEAGRGPLAGPVVAAAVILPRRCILRGLNDSKQVPVRQRERLYEEIARRAIGVGIGLSTEREIDALNIVEATCLAMRRALHALAPAPDFLLVDALSIPFVRLPQRSIIHGDEFSLSIAAASIMAKISRDYLMRDYHRRFPSYNFRRHKGYATAQHLDLLATHGPCELHRMSFRPLWGAT